ncbi:MAG: peptide chain release factor N(5)-glutamine methyltransferase [bacterium]|nr:MAG: peptide chain release factor N(5)-glutamine methyltransferase [bacterium]
MSTGEERVTVMEAVKLAQGYLEERGIDSARLNAEHLLAKALECSRLDLYLRFDERLEDKALGRYREDLKQRAGHIPLQYILGEFEFCSLRFRIERGIFIPRPETELLVERVEALLGAARAVRFIEFGVGSGVIAGALAARNPGWNGVAFDVSDQAVHLAERNINELGLSAQVCAFVGDGFDAVRTGVTFDLLVSNPPYIPTGVVPTLQDEVAKFEDHTALDGGEDGTAFYPLLAGAGVRLVRPGGLIALEIGDGQGAAVEEILRGHGYERVTVERDYNGMERIVTAQRPSC